MDRNDGVREEPGVVAEEALVKKYADVKEALRQPFLAKQIRKLPATKGDPNTGKGKRPALDYVGHATVTDRLNFVLDEDWHYTIDNEFLHGADYWVRGTMTICGVSRVEYGDGKNPKDAIGNFLRRAAMRFGVGLDLWEKNEIKEAQAQASTKVEPPTVGKVSEGQGMAAVDDPPGESKGKMPSGAGTGEAEEQTSTQPLPLPITEQHKETLRERFGSRKSLEGAREMFQTEERPIKNIGNLTADEAWQLIQALEKEEVSV